MRQVCYPEPRLCDSHIHLFPLGRPAIRGDRCLARELAHQTQQRRGGAPDDLNAIPQLLSAAAPPSPIGRHGHPHPKTHAFPARACRADRRATRRRSSTRRRASRLDCSRAPRSGRDSAPRARTPGAAGRGSTGCPRSRKPRPRSHRPCAVLIQSIMPTDPRPFEKRAVQEITPSGR